MTDKPREWPNVAREQRDRAAETACHGLRLLVAILEDEDMSRVEELRRISLALNDFQQIARVLESVGAQTRP